MYVIVSATLLANPLSLLCVAEQECIAELYPVFCRKKGPGGSPGEQYWLCGQHKQLMDL